jgi:hypothetical protein
MRYLHDLFVGQVTDASSCQKSDIYPISHMLPTLLIETESRSINLIERLPP